MVFDNGKTVKSRRTGDTYALLAKRGSPIRTTDLDSDGEEYIPGNLSYFINGQAVDQTSERVFLNSKTNEEFEEI